MGSRLELRIDFPKYMTANLNTKQTSLVIHHGHGVENPSRSIQIHPRSILDPSSSSNRWMIFPAAPAVAKKGHGGSQEQPRIPERHRAPADRHRHEGRAGAGGWPGDGFERENAEKTWEKPRELPENHEHHGNYSQFCWRINFDESFRDELKPPTAGWNVTNHMFYRLFSLN